MAQELGSRSAPCDPRFWSGLTRALRELISRAMTSTEMASCSSRILAQTDAIPCILAAEPEAPLGDTRRKRLFFFALDRTGISRGARGKLSPSAGGGTGETTGFGPTLQNGYFVELIESCLNDMMVVEVVGEVIAQ